MTPLDGALIIFGLMATLNYRVQRSVLYPPFLFSAMWLLDLAVYRLNIIEVNPVHGNTLVIVSIGAISFSAGGLLACLIPRAIVGIRLFSLTTTNTPYLVRNILMFALVCGLPVMLYQILQLSKLGYGGSNFLMQARTAQLEAGQGGPASESFTLTYFTWIAIFSSLLFATEKRDRQFWIVTGVALFACILSTGRTNLLLLISGLGAIRLLQSKRETFLDSVRMLRWPITIFFALYIGLIFINKSTDAMTGGAFGIATFLVVSYIVSPLAAFDGVVQHPADFAETVNHTFQFPLKIASAFHLTDYTAPPILDKFTLVPFPTNVYTIFKFYFLELGITGTMIILFLIGLLHSLLYLKAKRGGRLGVYLFAFSIYAVLMVIFDDAYYTTGIYLRAFVFGLVYYLLGMLHLRMWPAKRHENCLNIERAQGGS